LDLIWRNCFAYNDKDSYYYAEAERIKEKSDELVKHYREKLDPSVLLPPPPGSRPLPPPPPPAPAPAPVRTPKITHTTRIIPRTPHSSSSITAPATAAALAAAAALAEQERLRKIRERELRDRGKSKEELRRDRIRELKRERKRVVELVLQRSRERIEFERCKIEVRRNKERIRLAALGALAPTPATPIVPSKMYVVPEKPPLGVKTPMMARMSTPSMVPSISRPYILQSMTIQPVIPLQHSTLLPPQVATNMPLPALVASGTYLHTHAPYHLCAAQSVNMYLSFGLVVCLLWAVDKPKLRRRYLPASSSAASDTQGDDHTLPSSALPISGFSTAWSAHDDLSSSPDDRYTIIVPQDAHTAPYRQGSTYYASYVSPPSFGSTPDSHRRNQHQPYVTRSINVHCNHMYCTDLSVRLLDKARFRIKRWRHSTIIFLLSSLKLKLNCTNSSLVLLDARPPSCLHRAPLLLLHFSHCRVSRRLRLTLSMRQALTHCKSCSHPRTTVLIWIPSYEI
jgi:hypothetical protein